MPAPKKTVTLEEAAALMGINERSLRQVRTNYPDLLPSTQAYDGNRGRPRTLLYKSDVLAVKKKIRAGLVISPYVR